MYKTRFVIITPTIGRNPLRRCVSAITEQVWTDYRQIVVGDGPQESWVKEFVESHSQCIYLETLTRTNNWGCDPRNLALEKIETDYPADYIIFVDDDNVLLESALHNIHWKAISLGEPPLLCQDICFLNKYTTKYVVYPTVMPPEQTKWDGLNGIYRADVVKGLRWIPGYAHDFFFTKEAMKKAGVEDFPKVEGINGIHHLSWDTYTITP